MLDKTGFDLWADGYDKAVGLSDDCNTYPFAGYRQVLALIYSRCLSRGTPTVLDIGFGTGALTSKLYDAGCRIYGQAFSPKMLAAAQAKMPDAKLYCGDFTQGLHPELASRRYDFIVSTYALHHLSDSQKLPFLAKILELLEPGGELLIGDVAFGSRAQLEECRTQVGDGWDDEEFYFVCDELARDLPGLWFQRVSYCSGVVGFCN
ncbi:MAG: class I SAM-dependent methyltransferase [Acutalibacter sp.]|jgi:SAM-dependent methyltransferase|uniref:class I SAM-dependent methyltransferase n=1 Tax=Acutalibacter sp. TaxID=1918636 RepID=UPI0021706F54|nr:class I SAM-dependent methyltransferase [Acutalibacter sp.]MCI9224323.1 class I SAM-dependent methyltransferase [Acutalibacter sp.]